MIEYNHRKWPWKKYIFGGYQLMKETETCTIIDVKYEGADTIEKQGNRDSITEYLKKGYYVKVHRNGYWVLVKPSRAIAIIKSSAGVQEINIVDEIIDLYGKSRISKKQIDDLKTDIRMQRISICINEKGKVILKIISES